MAVSVPRNIDFMKTAMQKMMHCRFFIYGIDFPFTETAISYIIIKTFNTTIVLEE